MSQGRLPYPLKLEGLPANFSEQAKFDREKGFTPVRITFISEEDEMELFRYWPENRIPTDYKDPDDISAEGKYNPELFEAAESPVILEDNSPTTSDDTLIISDEPLLEF